MKNRIIIGLAVLSLSCYQSTSTGFYLKIEDWK